MGKERNGRRAKPKVILADFQSYRKGLLLLEQMGLKLFSVSRNITGCICLEGTNPG